MENRADIMGYFAGIGSRRMPASEMHKVEELSLLTGHLQLCLRSGGAGGADDFLRFLLGRQKSSCLGMALVDDPWQKAQKTLNTLCLNTMRAMSIGFTLNLKI